MYIQLKTKIWLTVLSIVLMFTFFTLYYFPKQEGDFLLNNYNSEVQNLANTVALGVKIALNEQDYEGVQTAMEYVKDNPGLKFVSLVQIDTTWDATHRNFKIGETIFKTFPDNIHPSVNITSGDSLIIKNAPFHTSLMSGAIMLAFTTNEISASKKNIRETSLLVSGCIFLIGLLISLWLSKRISVPVVELRNAAMRISEGDLTPVIKNHSKDEIGDLAKAFNKMIGDLSRAREELSNSNQNLSIANKTLNEALNELKATQTQLVQSEKMASLGELTAGIAHEIQNPLNFVNNFSEVNSELITEMKEEIDKGNFEEAKQIAEDIENNEKKIIHHGRRADAIVKGMLQHSRISTGQKELTDINALTNEYLRLAYHGLRAKDKTFNATLHTDFDDSIGKINVVPQDIGRVLLNLFNNAFYAVDEKKKQLNNTSYEPTVSLITKKVDNKIAIYVKDNGNGIPQKALDKIFQPFFTTKPTGEGTGLGLSLSYDIIQAHGGEIKVETKEGEGTTFIISLFNNVNELNKKPVVP